MLLSGGKIAQSGAETILKDNLVLVVERGSVVLREGTEILLQGERRKDGLYEISTKIDQKVLDKFQLVKEQNVKVNKISVTGEELHNLFGHLSIDWIKSSKSIMNFYEIVGESDHKDCNICGTTKKKRNKFNRSRNEKLAKLGERIITDVIGNITPPAYDWSEYIVEFIEEYSDYTEGIVMKFKSESAAHLLNFISFVKAQTGKKVRFVRSDGGGEFTSNELEEELKKKGIVHDTNPLDTPQRTGKEERRHQTLFSMTRALLNQSKLPKKYWPLAYYHCVFIYNLGSPRNEEKSRLELLMGDSINTSELLKHVHKFGESVFYSDNNYKKKLDNRANEGLWVGYDWRSNIDLVLDVETGKVIRSRDVSFKNSIEYEFSEEDEEELEIAESEEERKEVAREEERRLNAESEESSEEEDEEDEEEKEVVEQQRQVPLVVDQHQHVPQVVDQHQLVPQVGNIPEIRVRVEKIPKDVRRVVNQINRAEKEARKEKGSKVADYSKNKKREKSSKKEDHEFWRRANALKIVSKITPLGKEIRVPSNLNDDKDLSEDEKKMWDEARREEWNSFIDNEVPE